MRKTLTLLILLSTLSFYAHSETFYVDGLKYETDTENLTASLTGYEGDKPTDELIIPSSITVGDVEYTVTSVGAYAFFNCSSLTSIVLPESLTEIGNYAFRFCSQLTDIKANWETPLTVTSSYVFSTYSTATLSVPVGTLEAYQADSFWGQFANIVEDSTLAVEGNLVVDETKVYTIGGELMVSGVTNGTAIKVYNLNGVNVANSVVLDGAAQVELPTASGIYIVTVGNQSYKVVR